MGLSKPEVLVLIAGLGLIPGIEPCVAAPPYPPSQAITGVGFDWATHVRRAPGSDNWPITWADDDHQYTSWGDGGGFGGSNSDGRVSLGFARIEGPKNGYAGYNVWGGKNPENPASFPGKSYGMLCVGTDLYAFVNECSCTEGTDRLYKSTNHGASWSPASWIIPPGGGAATFLQFGKAYAGARDDFVYVYSPMEKWDAPATQVWLARVPKTQIMTWSSWQFYGGTVEGNPTWTSWSGRQAVFRDTRVGWAVSVSYNPGIERYLLCSTHENPMTGSGLGIFDAPEPWGPWTTVAYFDDWHGLAATGSTFFYCFSNKWMSPDGLSFVMVWTGTGDHDAWNTVEGTFDVASRITGITWADPAEIVTAAEGSDNWPMTWGDDDSLYTAYGDGWGFTPRVPAKLSLGFAHVMGPPTAFYGANIHPTNGDQTGDGKSGRKASGMLMVDGVLYMWVRNAAADASGTRSMLAWSTDHAQSWTFGPWVIAELGCPCFVNYGKNYANARDDYVYSLSPNTPSAYDETDDVVLMRVHKTQITNRAAYEFFKGFDANRDPVWTSDISQRTSVFRLAGGCNRLDVTYNPPLRRYMMTMRSRNQTGRGLDQFSLYEAPEPWGPWTQFFYTTNWDVDEGESAHIPSKWISPDGMEIHLVFSGNDSFRVRKGTLAVTGAKPPDPASRPSPPDGARNVSRRPTITWAGGARAASHDVYFGTAHPPPFQRNQTETVFAPVATYPPNTTCYWRVDELNDAGTTPGPLWSFTTRCGDLDPKGDPDGDVDQADFGVFQACFTGSGGHIEPGCEQADLDEDDDVDLGDFGVFQSCVGGAKKPPNC